MADFSNARTIDGQPILGAGALGPEAVQTVNPPDLPVSISFTDPGVESGVVEHAGTIETNESYAFYWHIRADATSYEIYRDDLGNPAGFLLAATIVPDESDQYVVYIDRALNGGTFDWYCKALPGGQVSATIQKTYVPITGTKYVSLYNGTAGFVEYDVGDAIDNNYLIAPAGSGSETAYGDEDLTAPTYKVQAWTPPSVTGLSTATILTANLQGSATAPDAPDAITKFEVID